MTHEWLGYTSDGCRDELAQALAQVDPAGHLTFAQDAADIRSRLRDEEPGTVGAIVGLSKVGVSDVNLAAALVSDRRAREVVLVARFVTGSLRSRAAQAGIARVVDIDDVLFDQMAAGLSAPVGQPGKTDAQSRQRAGLAPIVVFASGRGGVGKSALAALCAVAASGWGMRVALADLDYACGNVASYLGVGRWRDPSELAVSRSVGVHDVLRLGMEVAPGLTFWGPCERPEMAERAMPLAGQVLAAVRTSCDLVIVDTSSTCTDAVAQAMQASDRLVLVSDEGSGVASLARTSALAVRLGVARARIMRVENGCAPRLVGTPFVPRLEVGLETARAFRVADGGQEVRDLLDAGHADELALRPSDFSRSVTAMLAQALQELGCLPEGDGPAKALEYLKHRTRRQLFGRKREVA